MEILSSLGKTTPSEQKVIYNATQMENRKVLCLARNVGGDLIVYFEKTDVRKTKKHTPPFKYQAKFYNKWGKLLFWTCGNIWDSENNNITDDFTRVAHNPRYKRLCSR